MPLANKHVAVIGGGWAGCAAAVYATQAGAKVSVLEATDTLGGRARRVPLDGLALDNGQHILIGAYRETLALLRALGVDEKQAFLRLPMQLKQPNGKGLEALNALRQWPRLAMGWAMATAQGWTWADKLSLARVALRWEIQGFVCEESATALDACQGMRHAVLRDLIEPLCVSALNTPAHRASGKVLLRVLRDALFGEVGGSDFLLPKVDLSALMPERAQALLSQQGSEVRTHCRVLGIERTNHGFLLHTSTGTLQADAVVIAAPPVEAARLAAPHNPLWRDTVLALTHEAIATVYAMSLPLQALPRPLLALPSDADHPAQFVFDRGALGGPPGLLAFVVSANAGDAASLQAAVLRQAKTQLGLSVDPLKTIVEKRATFACTPGIRRAPTQIAQGIVAAGDHIDGPYPATLEGAVRSAQAAIKALGLG